MPEGATTDDSSRFKAALARETLLSERKRALALATILGALTISITAMFLAVPSFGAMMPGMTAWMPLAYYGSFGCFEIVVVAIIDYRLSRDQDFPIALRYLTAAIEVSLPTTILIAHANKMGLANATGYFAPFLYTIFIVLSTLRLDFWLVTFTSAVAALEMLAVALLYLPAPASTMTNGMVGEAMGMSNGMRAGLQSAQSMIGYHVARSLALFAGGLTAAWVALRIRHQFVATMKAVGARDAVTNLFGQHVSPQVVDRLLASGTDTGSEIRRVAVMFVDIRGFTAEAQRHSPVEVVSRLNAAFTVMVDAINRHGGIVNKFLGDGFLAIFGAPLLDEHATRRAVAAGREMLTALEKHNVGRVDWPIRVGIGLHVGEAVTGVVGSAQRKEYTVMGDTVNLASRIEAANKEFGCQFLISDDARREAGDEAVGAIPLGGTDIRGYDRPVHLWRVA